MFRNLLAEMVRSNLTPEDIAKCLNVSAHTARNYLNGKTKINWVDTLRIKNTFFPDLQLEYLFEIEKSKAS